MEHRVGYPHQTLKLHLVVCMMGGLSCSCSWTAHIVDWVLRDVTAAPRVASPQTEKAFHPHSPLLPHQDFYLNLRQEYPHFDIKTACAPVRVHAQPMSLLQVVCSPTEHIRGRVYHIAYRWMESASVRGDGDRLACSAHPLAGNIGPWT